MTDPVTGREVGFAHSPNWTAGFLFFLPLATAALAWLVAGGLSYTLGVIFFAWERLRFNHAIWHLFVLLGSACHVVAVTLYVLR